MNCLIYARVSTDKQAERELSIPAQLQAMRRYAKDRDWVILEEFVEAGVSARTADRPILHQLLQRSRNPDTTKVDVVLVHKIDRLARNVADHIAILAQLRDSKVALASVTESLEDSVAGQLVEHILASMAEFYSANLSEEVKKGMRQKIAQGGWPHVPPRGYRLVPNVSGLGRVVTIDSDQAPLIRHLFEVASRGFLTWHRFRHAMANEGLKTSRGRPLSPGSLAHLLENPFYIGQLRWNGGLHPGSHPPLVDRWVFERVQQVLKTRGRAHPNRRLRFLMRGVATCRECGNLLTAEVHRRFVYYRCLRRSKSRNACKAKFCNASRAHASLEVLYRQLLLPIGIRRQLQVEVQKGDQSPRRPAGLDLARTRSGRGSPTDLRAATTVWEAHSALTLGQQQVLLKAVFAELVLSPEGIERFALKPPFDRIHEENRRAA